MGSPSAYSSIIIGVEVTYEDFVTTSKTGERQCAKGHPANGDDKFCSQCGGPVGEKFVRTATEKLKQFCAQTGVVASKVLEHGDFHEMQCELDPRGIHVGHAYTDSEQTDTLFVIGVAILENGVNYYQYDGRALSMSIREFVAAIKKAQALVAACGFDPESVRVYSTKSMSW